MEKGVSTLQETGGTRLSFFQKLGLIYSNPRQVFENIRHYPDWILPVLSILIFSLINVYLMQDLGIESQKERIVQSEQIPEEQKEIILERMEQGIGPIQQLMMYGGTVIFVLGSIFLVAALYMFSGNFVLGGSVSYQSMLAVYVWGFMVTIPEIIIKIPLALAKNSIHVYTSLAVFFDSSQAQSTLFKSANAVDIFSIWRLVLWSIGFGIIYNVSTTKSFAIITMWYIIWVFIAIGFSSLVPGM